MADRTSPEIEDVLASIRRLVSEDVKGGGPRRRAAERLTGRADEGDGAPQEALVLTPDFRVGTDRQAPAGAGPSAARTAALDADAPYDLATIEDAIQDLEAAIDAGEDAVGVPWEADGSEADDWTPPEPETARAQDPAPPAPELAPEKAAGPDAAPEAAPEEAAEPVAAPEAVPEEPAAAPPPPQEEVARPASGDGADGWDASPRAGRIDPAADDAEFVDDAGEADETVVDEETLRAIVAEVLREELQGALGERITRNVRKLVRREINQALATREFD